MKRISDIQQRLDAQALLLHAQVCNTAPSELVRTLDEVVAASVAPPLARAQHREAVLREVHARKGQLSPAARKRLEAFFAELKAVDLDTLRQAMHRPEESPRVGSPVGKAPSSRVLDPGVDRAVLSRSLRMGRMKDWTLVQGIRAEEGGRGTVPTELGPLQVDISGKSLRIVQGATLRSPTDQEASALATVLGATMGLARADQPFIYALVKSLEAARGPLYLPCEVKALPDGQAPKGLLAAELIDPASPYASLRGLLRDQGPQPALTYAFQALHDSNSNVGFGALSPDGKSQYLRFQDYSTPTPAQLCAIAASTGRTIHTTVLGVPTYAGPQDQPSEVEARTRSFNISMGWTRHDSEADHRKELASYREKALPRGTVVETAKSLGSRYGDYGLAGMATIRHRDNMMELLLHLRNELPPEALRDQVNYAVSHGQVPLGSEQAWLDTLRRVLLG